MTPPNTIHFEIQTEPTYLGPWIRPRIDGQTLPESLTAFYNSQPESTRNTYAINPWYDEDDAFGENEIVWNPDQCVARLPIKSIRRAIATTCDCGQYGCSCIAVDITVTADTVKWTFNQDFVKAEWHREPVPTWVFERMQYEEACRALFVGLGEPEG